MRENRHLKVATEVDEDEATKAALKQMANRIPRELRAYTDWESPEAVAFFEGMNTVLRSDRMSSAAIEDAVGITGVSEAYWEWAGEQG